MNEKLFGSKPRCESCHGLLTFTLRGYRCRSCRPGAWLKTTLKEAVAAHQARPAWAKAEPIAKKKPRPIKLWLVCMASRAEAMRGVKERKRMSIKGIVGIFSSKRAMLKACTNQSTKRHVLFAGPLPLNKALLPVDEFQKWPGVCWVR